MCRVKRSVLGVEGFRNATAPGVLGSKRVWRVRRGVCRMNVDRRANWAAVQGRSRVVDMLDTGVIVSSNDDEGQRAKEQGYGRNCHGGELACLLCSLVVGCVSSTVMGLKGQGGKIGYKLLGGGGLVPWIAL